MNSIPGLNYPTLQAINGTTPRDAAFQSGLDADAKLATLTSIGGWGRQIQKYANKSKNTKGTNTNTNTKHIRNKPDPKIVLMGGVGNANIVVPELLPTYKEVGGPGQTVSDINVQLARIGTQGASNAQYDKYANVAGGAYKKRKSIRKNRKTKTKRIKKSKKSRMQRRRTLRHRKH